MTLTIQSSASPKGESPLRRNLALFASSKMSLFFLGLTLAFVVMAVFAPWIAPHDPNEPDLFDEDRVHPSIEGGRVMGEFLAEVIQQAE